MNDQVKASAKLAREFLEMIAGGIGKLEAGAGDFKELGVATASRLARRLPAKWSGRSMSSTSVVATLLAAGVVATTAALIYQRTKGGKSARRRRR